MKEFCLEVLNTESVSENMQLFTGKDRQIPARARMLLVTTKCITECC